jgi:hypothetical protein
LMVGRPLKRPWRLVWFLIIATNLSDFVVAVENQMFVLIVN